MARGQERFYTQGKLIEGQHTVLIFVLVYVHASIKNFIYLLDNEIQNLSQVFCVFIKEIDMVAIIVSSFCISCFIDSIPIAITYEIDCEFLHVYMVIISQ